MCLSLYSVAVTNSSDQIMYREKRVLELIIKRLKAQVCVTPSACVLQLPLAVEGEGAKEVTVSH